MIEKVGVPPNKVIEVQALIGVGTGASPLMSPLVWDLAHIGNYEDQWLLGALGATRARPDLDGIYVTWAEPAEGFLAALRTGEDVVVKVQRPRIRERNARLRERRPALCERGAAAVEYTDVTDAGWAFHFEQGIDPQVCHERLDIAEILTHGFEQDFALAAVECGCGTFNQYSRHAALQRRQHVVVESVTNICDFVRRSSQFFGQALEERGRRLLDAPPLR